VHVYAFPTRRSSDLHVGTVMVDGQKMAKSAGNLVFVHELLEEWPATAVRLLLLDRPWRDAWEYTPAGLASAADRVDALRSRAARSEEHTSELQSRFD